MKHLVLGTAGHIDHGKTTLVKALTGIDTDTLEEEKLRGISINLGYAHYDLSGGTRIGIVDVPGHIRFVKTMVAGAAGIDFVLFLVAADDSVMPQTREHFSILKLLGIRTGIIIITKCDLVDEETADIVELEIAELVKDSFLEKSPVVRLSSVTGQGMDKLKETIEQVALSLPERTDGSLFRMPVDRVFSVAGFGTVVTGTVFSGQVEKGEKLTLLPEGKEVEVRGLQVHHTSTSQAFAGQRVAVNLSGVSKEEVKRGTSLCAPGFFMPTSMLDCSLELLNETTPLRSGLRIKLHLGTNESLGRLYLLEKGLVQIRLEELVVAVKGDRYILRDEGALTTLGGGVVLDPHPQKHKRKKNVDSQAIEDLALAENRERIVAELKKTASGLTVDALCARLSLKRKQIVTLLTSLSESRFVVLLSSGASLLSVEKSRFEAWVLTMGMLVHDYHETHPLFVTGMPKAEVIQKSTQLLGEAASKLFTEPLYVALCEHPRFREEQSTLVLAGWKVEVSDEMEKLKSEAVQLLVCGGFSPPDKKTLLEKLNHKRAEESLTLLIREKTIVVSEGLFFAHSVLNEAFQKITEYLKVHDTAALTDIRQLLNTSRKFVLPLTHWLETNGLLIRDGERRRLAPPPNQ